jgi:hypothetical protein
MPSHPRPAARDAAAPDLLLDADADDPGMPRDPRPPATPSLAGLGIAGISRRQVAWVGLAVLAAWIVIGFAGQAAEAARMTVLLGDARGRNAAVAAQTEALRRELELVTQERWVLQQARAYQLGSRKERPFALAPDAPPLPPDAAGSAARRVGAEPAARSPLDAWLDVLFGPSGG